MSEIENEHDPIERYLRPFVKAMYDKDQRIAELETEVSNLQYVDEIKTDDQHRLLKQNLQLRNDLTITATERDNLRNTVSRLEAAMVPINSAFARNHRQYGAPEALQQARPQQYQETARDRLRTAGI